MSNGTPGLTKKAKNLIWENINGIQLNVTNIHSDCALNVIKYVPNDVYF